MGNVRALIIAGILVILVIVGGIFLYSQTAKKSSNNAPTPTQTTTADGQNTHQITLTPDGFSPSTITIKAGTQVTWTNKSGQLGDVDSDPHPVHTSYPPMNFGTFSDGSTFSLTFDKPGTYHYHNHLNPSQTGTIVVQ